MSNDQQLTELNAQRLSKIELLKHYQISVFKLKK